MYTVPEWATVGLLALYYGSLFLCLRFFDKIRSKLGMIFVPATVLYILLEGALLLIAFLTAKEIEYVFVAISVMMILFAPFLVLSVLNTIAKEARE